MQCSCFRDQAAPGSAPCVAAPSHLCLDAWSRDVPAAVIQVHTACTNALRLESRLCLPRALHQGGRKASEARVQPTLSLEDGTVVYEAAALMSVNYEDLLTA